MLRCLATPVPSQSRIEEYVLDADLLQRIFSQIPRLRDDQDDRFADMANNLLRQWNLRSFVKGDAVNGGWRDKKGAILPIAAQIARRVNGCNSLELPAHAIRRSSQYAREHAHCARKRRATFPDVQYRPRTVPSHAASAGPRCVLSACRGNVRPCPHPYCASLILQLRQACRRRMRKLSSLHAHMRVGAGADASWSIKLLAGHFRDR